MKTKDDHYCIMMFATSSLLPEVMIHSLRYDLAGESVVSFTSWSTIDGLEHLWDDSWRRKIEIH
jgi:hypothetical protein